MPINNTASSKDENHPDLATVQALLLPRDHFVELLRRVSQGRVGSTHRAGKDQTGKVQAWHSYQDVWATVPGNQAQCPSKHVAVIVQWFTTFGRPFLPTASAKPTVTAAASTTTPTRHFQPKYTTPQSLPSSSKESSFWCIGSRSPRHLQPLASDTSIINAIFLFRNNPRPFPLITSIPRRPSNSNSPNNRINSSMSRRHNPLSSSHLNSGLLIVIMHLYRPFLYSRHQHAPHTHLRSIYPYQQQQQHMLQNNVGSTSVHQIIQFHHWQPNQQSQKSSASTSPKKETAALAAATASDDQQSSAKRRRSSIPTDQPLSPTPNIKTKAETPPSSASSSNTNAIASALARRKSSHSRNKSETTVLRGDISKMSLYSTESTSAKTATSGSSSGSNTVTRRDPGRIQLFGIRCGGRVPQNQGLCRGGKTFVRVQVSTALGHLVWPWRGWAYDRCRAAPGTSALSQAKCQFYDFWEAWVVHKTSDWARPYFFCFLFLSQANILCLALSYPITVCLFLFSFFSCFVNIYIYIFFFCN